MMIFQQLINFWKGDSGLKNIFSKFDDMMIIAKEMFEKATNNVFSPSDDLNAESRELVKWDGRINALQQSIRRDVVLHITVKGSKDTLPCLLLMSLVKDAERLGDYAKNIMEVAERYHDFEKDNYFETLKIMRGDILKWFDETKIAFDNTDAKHAQITREKAYESEKECDRIAWEMMEKTDKKDNVAIALLFRFFKRIAAHLDNIATSVIVPIDKLDYHDEL